MLFRETILPGVFEIEPELKADDRGFFARTWCSQEFQRNNLSARLAQCSISHNRRKGTLRGMHLQREPHAEAKLVRCTAGAIYDVAVDLRPGSPWFKKWVGVTLSAVNRRMLFIPEGCAHGFLTLADDTEVFYQISEFYHPESGTGVRWNDPSFGIEWPAAVEVIADRDRNYPDFQ